MRHAQCCPLPTQRLRTSASRHAKGKKNISARVSCSMANEIRVLSTIGMRTVVDALAPAFERRRGCTVTRVYDSSVALMQRIDAGETGDAAVFTAAAIDALIAQHKVARRTDLARSFVGVAVRKGAPRPDIT